MRIRIVIFTAFLAAWVAVGLCAAGGREQGPSKEAIRKKYVWEFQKRKIEYRKALAHINVYRKLMNIRPVKLDEKLCMAAQQHADYLVRNKLRLSHRQTFGSPGYIGREFTDRIAFFGGKNGAFECISANSNFSESVDNDISSVYHRLPFLNPNYDRVGLGLAEKTSVADFGYGPGEKNDKPVLYPGDGQKGVPSFWLAKESPNPLAQFGRPKVVGYPISARFSGPVTVVSATLSCSGQKRVPVFVLSRENDTMKLLKKEVFLIAKQPMKIRTEYTVKLTAKVGRVDKTVNWSFTTSADSLPVKDTKQQE